MGVSMGVCMGASIMGVSMGVVAGVCVACIATAMICGVASMAWALVVLSIHYNPLQFWPWSPSNRECDFETDSILSAWRTASKSPRRRSNMELRPSADIGYPIVNLETNWLGEDKLEVPGRRSEPRS